MKINNTQNNVSFKMTHEIVDSKKFMNLIINTKNSKEIKVGSLLLGSYGEIKGEGNIYTLNIGSCITYLLNTPFVREILGHYNKSAQEVTQFIESFIGNGGALAIGGKTGAMSDFFDRDIQKFKDAKIKTTIFYGQNETSSNIWFNADNDTCYIFKPLDDIYIYDEVKKDYIPTRQCADSIKKVKSSYKIIHIADGDKVKINDQFVDPKYLNQNDKEYTW